MLIFFDRLGKFPLFRFRQIIVARNWFVVLIFARAAGEDIERRLGAFTNGKPCLFDRFLERKLPARLDEACTDGGDAEILVCPQERQPLPHRKRERAVVFEKDDALIGNLFCDRLVFPMLSVIRSALGGRYTECTRSKLFPLFIAEARKLHRVSRATSPTGRK